MFASKEYIYFHVGRRDLVSAIESSLLIVLYMCPIYFYLFDLSETEKDVLKSIKSVR